MQARPARMRGMHSAAGLPHAPAHLHLPVRFPVTRPGGLAALGQQEAHYAVPAWHGAAQRGRQACWCSVCCAVWRGGAGVWAQACWRMQPRVHEACAAVWRHTPVVGALPTLGAGACTAEGQVG